MSSSKPIERIVILGGSGFVGKALVQYYEREGVREVHGFSSSSLNLLNSDDLQKLETLIDKKTALIVASAVTRERGDTFQVFQDNVRMTAHVARFLETHAVGKCVYYSSIAVYGDLETNLSINEKTKAEPESYYALAKYVGEFVLAEAAQRIGFPLLILRASRVYGPGDSHATYGPMKFIRTILDEGQLYLFGEGEELRDHLYIADLVSLTDPLIQSLATGIFNLATGKSHTFQELVEILREISPREFQVVPMERKKSLIHQEFDIQKLSRAVPDFRFTDIRRGLAQTFESFVSLDKKTASSLRPGL